MTILYHAHLPDNLGNFNTGYIGITDNFQQRVMRHKAGYSGSPVLKRALAKYKDIIFTPISEGSRSDMLELEHYFRPTQKGWNACAGGGDPPSAKGKRMSETQKSKIGVSNSGRANSKWKGWWVVDGTAYESARICANALGVTKRTVLNRVLNPNFTNWTFKETESVDNDLSRI